MVLYRVTFRGHVSELVRKQIMIVPAGVTSCSSSPVFRSLTKAMISTFFTVCFCIFLLKCQLSILHGLEVEPTKGETCSINGGPSILENGEENACFKEGLYSTSNIRLPRREAITVGHEQEIQLDEGRNLQLTTLSMKPPIFEIADFLSDQECDHLVKLAKRNGFEKSTVPKAATVTREGVNETLTNNQMQIICRRIIRFDSNKDGKVSLNEFAGYAYRMTKMLVDINELLTVYKTLLPEEAEVFTLENCTKLNRTNFVEFVYRLFNMNRLPYFSVRYSEHSWIDLDDRDPILNRIKSRIAKVSQMSVSHIEHSENLQVSFETEVIVFIFMSMMQGLIHRLILSIFTGCKLSA